MRFLRQTTPVVRWGAALFIAVSVIAIWLLTRTEPQQEGVAEQVPYVTLAAIADLSSQISPLPVTGKVTSRSNATVLAQSPGQIVSLRKSIGDRVSAGEVIATLENSSQYAAVQQAQGAYDSAQAALSKVSGSVAENSNLSLSLASQSAQNTLASLQSSMQSMYATLDDAIHTKADNLFSNPRSTNPVFTPSISNSQLVVSLQNDRLIMGRKVSDAQLLFAGMTSDNAIENAADMLEIANHISSFLNSMIEAVNLALPNPTLTATTISTYQTTLATGRSAVVSAISSLTAAKGAYESALTSTQIAANTASTASGTDIAAAEANAKTALGGLNAAKASLEKTIVRSPIAGTIVSLPIHEGDFVSSFAQVAQISNPDALEVQSYVTAEDARSLSVGGKSVIGDGVEGVITSIAPAIDPTTGKILVKIGIRGDTGALVAGSTESVTLARTSAITKPREGVQAPISIPIIAAKITPDGPVVFTVDESSRLVAHPITFGAIAGDTVRVLTGVTPDMQIVTDARGLQEGEVVMAN